MMCPVVRGLCGPTEAGGAAKQPPQDGTLSRGRAGALVGGLAADAVQAPRHDARALRIRHGAQSLLSHWHCVADLQVGERAVPIQ